MDTTQIPAQHPETGPRQLGVGSGNSFTGGEIIFNNPTPTLPATSPMDVINDAIAKGDSTEKRTRQFHETLIPEQK